MTAGTSHRGVNCWGRRRAPAIDATMPGAGGQGPAGPGSRVRAGFCPARTWPPRWAKSCANTAPWTCSRPMTAGTSHRGVNCWGSTAAPTPTSAAGSWAGANCARLMERAPASGPDLTALFGQLGLDSADRNEKVDFGRAGKPIFVSARKGADKNRLTALPKSTFSFRSAGGRGRAGRTAPSGRGPRRARIP